MSFSDRFARLFRNVLPAPFTIAVLLTFLTFILALVFTGESNAQGAAVFFNILEYWEMGLWDGPLMIFAMQMMLMLVLGHVLALTKPVNNLIQYAVRYCNNTANAAAIVTVLTLLVSFFNWGLGLVFGAIFARKVAENALRNDFRINYPVIGAAGYSGLMVWHGGLSGSAPIKVAEPGHFLVDKIGVISQSETIFSAMNISVSCALIMVLPAVMFFVGKRSLPEPLSLKTSVLIEDDITVPETGAGKLDQSRIIAWVFGLLFMVFAFYSAFIKPPKLTLEFITPNFINLVLLGIGILLHKNFKQFVSAVDGAISGASGILIQFPLYFGIMGIMKYSGLVTVFSDFFVSISNEATFPLFTFMSAAIVNVFVPSGGGQWAIQGPILAEAALQLQLPISKSIMALAYGDQITNMMQPFWALPLLGITGLKAKEILPYTLILMIAGAVIFISGLLIF